MEALVNPNDYTGTLKEASFDEVHTESLIDDEEHSVYILDGIAIKVGNMLEIDTPSSCDSVVVKGQDIYMIEYKNRDYQKVSSRDKREIRKKLYQSRELVLNTFWPTKGSYH